MTSLAHGIAMKQRASISLPLRFQRLIDGPDTDSKVRSSQLVETETPEEDLLMAC